MADKLPAAIELLWAGPGDPEPRQGLSVSRIVRTAVELADAGGLEAVSMAKIADRLGFTAMSLYRHVPGKDEVLLLMLDRVAAVPPELDDPGDDWRLGLERWCRAQWTMLRAHSWIPHLPITGPPITPNQLAWTDRALRTLRGTGLTEADKAGVVLLVAGHLLTAARMSAELGTAASSESVAAHSALLGELVDARRFPALRTAIEAGAFDYPESTAEPDREFGYAFGLDRILDGVAALIEKRATAGADR
ncbi:TetR/AcrR family transcriptional regulator [Amycolatopsis magusensis]|uniref:AcrR family transcriptional regulator n=1 Tax=Amycolatopsis magusensis TaxID=882444 RepID=A0ABS4PV56_9PSEU|nr:TetR/AcrR family transcriptional regulator [Amycolatopsis magusensis]MBP2183193.1 AcrR family transcriptional regulator [Amycolatopsis magusensis]